MSFKEVIEEIKKNPNYLSGYRTGLSGVIQVEGDQIVFRDLEYNSKSYFENVPPEHILANDWRLVHMEQD